MKGFFVSAAIIIGVLFVIMTFSGTGDSSDRVYLRPAPGNDVVQMFERVGAGDEGKITYFPANTLCDVIQQPKTVTVEGISMQFYYLDCNGTVGYVNARWVR